MYLLVILSIYVNTSYIVEYCRKIDQIDQVVIIYEMKSKLSKDIEKI